MSKRALQLGAAAAILMATMVIGEAVQAAPPGQPSNWQRFYNYPYVYYPHNFQKLPESYDHLYYRYPVQKQIPVYNTSWHNYYPSKKPYYMGHHEILDVF
ncbi:MAG TPA: hypothetical protein VM510_10820 [Caulifigura sp.]|jgi:hypothetical protein|nr:hypothetical protein [Caulifigura sp.]